MYSSESLLVLINNGMLPGDTIEMRKDLRRNYFSSKSGVFEARRPKCNIEVFAAEALHSWWARLFLNEKTSQQ